MTNEITDDNWVRYNQGTRIQMVGALGEIRAFNYLHRLLGNERIDIVPCRLESHADFHIVYDDCTISAVEVKSSSIGSSTWMTPTFYESSVGQIKRLTETYKLFSLPLLYLVMLNETDWAWVEHPSATDRTPASGTVITEGAAAVKLLKYAC